jgi:hypothetical protein
MRRMRRFRLSSRRVLVFVLVVGVLIELPLVYVFFLKGRTGGITAAVTTSAPSPPGGIGSLSPHPIALRFKPNNTKLSACRPGDQTCLEQAFGNIAYYRGPKVAVALVSKMYPGGAEPSCHRIMHKIGAASLTRFHGNIARTFAAGSSFCWSGYYHGVLERAFQDVKSYDAKTLGAKARTICRSTQIKADSWLAYQCLHGLGHGLMITTGYQLPLSLKVCRQLAGAWDQTSCKGGVFMENFVTSYGGQSPWVRDRDPLYPCDRVAQQDKYTCYQQATTRIIRVVGLHWDKIAKVCAGAEKAWVSICFGSFGQNASALSYREPPKTARICAIARPYGGEATCIAYAAEDMAGTYSSGKQAAVLCNLTTGKVRASCYQGIGRIMRYLRPNHARRLAECQAITHVAADVAECVRGTKTASSIPGLNRSSSTPRP